ncbi:MAG TPA: SpoIIE family protein phosphatase [Bacteroidia bacterium]
MNLEKYTNVSPKRVKLEFYRSTEKFHVIACWVGALLNLIWFASDYFVLPEHWIDFALFRLAVSVVGVVSVVYRKKLKISVYTSMFIVVLGISIQNAYMWSVMDLEHLHQHAFAYMVLFIGAGMLVLWELKLSIILLIVTVISNIVFYKLNSPLTFEEFLINGGLLTLTVATFCIFLIRSRYKLTYNEIKGRMELAKSKEIIEAEHNTVIAQKKEIEEKNDEILSSIRYAKRIQEALLPSRELINGLFNENFVLYKPRDIVSGDFYWASQVRITTGDKEKDKYVSLFALADCTGHGVPGAFMSLIGKNFLKQSSTERDVNSPADALDFLNKNVSEALNQNSKDGPVRDGMDIVLIAVDMETLRLQFSGANNPIYIVRNNELTILKADKQPIGSYSSETRPFTNNTMDLQKGDSIYLFTDGYADQFGGPDGKKFKYKQMQELLLEINHLPMPQQEPILRERFEAWKGNLEQVDDVCIIGIRL